MQYWLMKSEPNEFSIQDLRKRPRQIEHWDGVRNYQARNYMHNEMKKGDQILFYHSNCEVPGIVGIAQVARESYPDHTAFDPENSHYDPKSDPESPRWYMVDVKFVRELQRTISLQELKLNKKLAQMKLVQRGNRLSVMPVEKKEWNEILKME